MTPVKGKTIISEQFLSVEKELQNILNQLIEIRHQKQKYSTRELSRLYVQKYERFDYSAKDCYELAESIRKYVVPLKDKILLEKRETASGYASPVGCISCNSRSKST